LLTLSSLQIPFTIDEPKYVNADLEGAKVLAILTSNGFVDSIAADSAEGGSIIGLVLDKTSFYAESGGQINDIGSITGPSGSLSVSDAQVAAGYVLHIGEVVGSVSIGQVVKTSVDYTRRSKIRPNHTFTHILNYALRQVLGDHVDQKGSIVMPDKLRFDFSNNGVIEADKLGAVEAICRAQLASSLPVSSKEVPLSSAKDINGLRAVFGEVYPDPVRVVCIGRPIDELLAAPKAEDNRSALPLPLSLPHALYHHQHFLFS
jgi:alanyl-tRNA synthetase